MYLDVEVMEHSARKSPSGGDEAAASEVPSEPDRVEARTLPLPEMTHQRCRRILWELRAMDGRGGAR